MVTIQQRRASALDVALSGTGPAGVVLIVLILLAGNVLGAILVLIWRAVTRTPWSDLGFVRPADWGVDILGGMTGGVLLKVAMKAVVQPMMGIEAVNRNYEFIAGNTGAMLRMLVIVVFAAGFGEEIIWRGFLFERFRSFLGT